MTVPLTRKRRRCCLLTLQKLQQKVEETRSGSALGLAKVRRLLRLERQMKALSSHFMEEGFRAHHLGRDAQKKHFWNASANVLAVAEKCRIYAREALQSQPKRITFGYTSQKHAAPRWERGSTDRQNG